MADSAGLCGRAYSAVGLEDEEWLQAAKDGDVLPFMLVQYNSFIICIVLGEPLDSQESDDWVRWTRHKLSISDGRIVVIGGGPE